MRRGACAAVGCAFLLLLFAPESGGTSVQKLTLREIASRASRIVEMNIDSAGMVRDRRGRPSTRYTAKVASVLKGESAATIEWIQPGGTIDGESLVIAGIPQFAPGDSFIMFLSEESTAGHRLPIGLGQGAFRERLDAKLKKTILRAESGSVELIDPATGKRAAANVTEMEREAFLAEVRDYLK